MPTVEEMKKRAVEQAAKRVENGYAVKKELDAACEHALEVNEQFLIKLLKDNSQTEYGKKYGFADIKSIEEYKRKVPFSDYDDYEPYIRRMIENDEKDLITAYPVVHYATTTGSVGVPKRIPVSDRTLGLYNQYTGAFCHAVFDIYEKEHPEGYRRKFGKVTNSIEIIDTVLPNGMMCGPLSGALLRKAIPFLPMLYTSPKELVFPPAGKRIDKKYLKLLFALHDSSVSVLASSFMTALVDLMDLLKKEWPRLVKDVELGTIDAEAEMPDDYRAELEALLRPNPERAAMLRAEFEKGFDTPIAPRIWPRLYMILAIGTGGFVRYAEKMKQYTGDIPVHNSCYAASEALMGVAKEINSPEYVLIPYSCFFEFLPADAEDDAETLTMDQLEIGKYYEIIITTLSGFYRYRIKDVVQMKGWYNNSPTVCFAYRKNQMLSIAGEKTNDAAVSWAVEEFAKETGTGILEYSVYEDTDCEPGRYVILMEPEKPLDPEKMAFYEKIIDEKLSIANPSYGDKVKTGVLSPAKLHFVQPETYLLYREMMSYKGYCTDQLKPVRVLDSPAKKNFFFRLIDE